MAHYVGKILKIRPNEILDHWGVSELIVAYGVYRNEQQYKAFKEVQDFNKQAKKKIPRVNEYAVKFYTMEEFFELDGEEMELDG